ncbi:hypothetical protein NOR51B_853 [Luminiphilus syltensis NOR5-1B]|uniref:Uncharacterized protein n=1 Tax=Luminiphilus syltensis NOR5-1B TaxID=565045 RepID=B8KQS1_9GAMM|nr:hypothetical protein NOR51B_853 [Luminiphilus syltensis NOR5-1B]
MLSSLLIVDKRRVFWLLQFAGWFGWGSTHYLGTLIWSRPLELYPAYLSIAAVIHC